MKFKEVKIQKQALLSPKTKAEDLIRDFLQAKIETAEVTWEGEYRSINNACTSINRCADAKRYPVRAIIRWKTLYIVNTRGVDNE